MFRTSKCSHGDKGMCIHCLVNKNKQAVLAGKEPEAKPGGCKHPVHMKCLRCLPPGSAQQQCPHPDYEKCSQCQHLVRYEPFQRHLEALAQDCSHKKPCLKCKPPLSRKHYSIDRECRRHTPYPQGQCDSCMAPTLTVGTQKYAHVGRVVVRTTAVYRIVEANLFGILLGQVINDTVFIDDVYFPEEQQPGLAYINPQVLEDHRNIWEYLNLREVGLLYHSNHLSGLGLTISSLFQEQHLEYEGGHQLSKFITMRLQLGSEGGDPHFECFMVSDQLQAFHRHGLIYEKSNPESHFDLITTKAQNLSELPTFLRQGVETDRLHFKEALVWIETVSEESFLAQCSSSVYPFFTLDCQEFQDFRNYVQLAEDPLQKYRNIQFLLHLQRLIGQESMAWFIGNYLPYDPDFYLKERIPLLEKIEHEKLQIVGGHRYYNRDQ